MFFTATSLGLNAQCLTAVSGLYPAATFTPSVCDGVEANMITDLAYASEYSNVSVTLGQTYIFSSSIGTDYLTISADDGATSVVSGISPLTWIATLDGVVRFYTHADDVCTASTSFRERNVTCGIPAADLPDFVNLQSPGTGTLVAGSGAALMVYGQVYENGLTNAGDTALQAPGITAWIGVNDANTDPSTWSYWVPAAHNPGHVSNNDEYMAEIGADFLPGTYYYATRFRLNSGAYVYGGIDSAGVFGNFWNGTTYISGVLTVDGPANDDFANAEAITCGGSYSGDTSVASLDEDDAPDGGGADVDSPNLWYSFTGSGTPQTVTLSLCQSLYDTSVLVYTGTSGNLTLVGANDDGCGLTTRSYLNFNSDGTTTYYITVEGYDPTSYGEFTMEVTCADVQEPAVANQTCLLALAVEVDGTDLLSDNSFGDVTATQPTCDLFGSIQDVWFSFEAPASGSVDCSVSNGTMTSSNFNVYSGTCGALTAWPDACNNNQASGATESLTGLTSGELYYVQVWSNTAEQGTFSLRLTDTALGINNFESSNFAHYPNPVKDVLHIAYKSNISSVAIFNLLGQQVIAKSINARESQVDMTNLPNGAYMVKVTADNQVKTIKVLKQ